MPQPKVNIADSSGNIVGVTGNRLDVNLAAADVSIDIGDVQIKGHSTMLSGSNINVGSGSSEYLYGDDTSVPCKHVDIMADITNTGVIWVGSSHVAVGRGICLYAGDVYSLDIENLNLIHVISSVDNENITWTSYN